MNSSQTKIALTSDDTEYFESMHEAEADTTREIFGWMVDHFDDFDSIEMVDEAIDEFGEKYYYLEDMFFEELVDTLYDKMRE